MPDDSLQRSFDEADLDALRASIARVLDSEADRLKLHDYIDGKTRLDRILWDKAAELGWLAIGLPEEHGGLGFGPFGLDALHRQLGARTAPGPFLASLSAAQTLAEVADSETCEEWLPRLASGECTLAIIAQPIGTLREGKTWLLGTENAEAALVPLNGDDWGLMPLAKAKRLEMWDMTRPMLAADFSGATPVATLPGEAASRSLTRNLSLAIAGDSIGGARAIVEQTISYMKERQQFDRPIASFQALKHRIADLMTMIVSGEEFVMLAVEAAARNDGDARTWAILAKVRAVETYLHASKECVQLHGGVGFTWEFDVHLYLKRAMLSEMLVAPHNLLRDRAHEGFAEAFHAGRQPLELAL